MLAFTSVYFFELGLFNWLRAIQIKKSHALHLRLCSPRFECDPWCNPLVSPSAGNAHRNRANGTYSTGSVFSEFRCCLIWIFPVDCNRFLNRRDRIGDAEILLGREAYLKCPPQETARPS